MLIFVATLAIVFVIFFFIGRLGLLDRFEDRPWLFYAIAIFLALAVSFGVNMALKDIFMGEER